MSHEHEYQPPQEGELRSVCPALNTMANHAARVHLPGWKEIPPYMVYSQSTREDSCGIEVEKKEVLVTERDRADAHPTRAPVRATQCGARQDRAWRDGDHLRCVAPARPSRGCARGSPRSVSHCGAAVAHAVNSGVSGAWYQHQQPSHRQVFTA
ncbi:hypothetical protein GGX14DRAFT_556033 [Mycena pura]|uniref:Heme haloperoxidase family profile domain-containing protein n=1 Tax=Mycena pura TaxID=153505 RepID=A0AAD6YS14_9AGAR|nr:hypothetical protein GGX14DRAFT_556033 [Mycena pura]